MHSNKTNSLLSSRVRKLFIINGDRNSPVGRIFALRLKSPCLRVIVDYRPRCKLLANNARKIGHECNVFQYDERKREISWITIDRSVQSDFWKFSILEGQRFKKAIFISKFYSTKMSPYCLYYLSRQKKITWLRIKV